MRRGLVLRIAASAALLVLIGGLLAWHWLAVDLPSLDRLTENTALGGVSQAVWIAVVLAIIGVYLSKVKVYEETDEDLATQNHAVFAFLINLSYKRRIFEVFLDAFLITLSYYSAYVMLFGSFERSNNWDLFIRTVPLLIVLKLAAFLVVGVYRGIWRYTSIEDFITFTKGVVIGSVLSVVAVLLLYRFQNFSRAVFVLDGIILLLLIVGSRMAFRIIRQFLPSGAPASGRRVLIYGAGDGGEMILRELRNNSALNYLPVGFIDDDPFKQDKVIGGLRVFEANGSLSSICREKNIQEILVSSQSISHETLQNVREVCRREDIALSQAYLKIEPMEFE